MDKVKNISLKLSLIAAISLFSTVTLVIVLIGVDYSMHKALIKRSVAQIDRDMEILTNQLSDDIFINDWDAVERAFTAYSSPEEIRALELISDDLNKRPYFPSPSVDKSNSAISDNYFNPKIAAKALGESKLQIDVDIVAKRIGAYHPIEIPWYQRNSIKTKEALIYMSYDLTPGIKRTHQELTQTALLFTSIGSLGLLGMLLFFRFYVTKPLDTLAIASEKMASGNYSLRLPVSGNNEVGRLEAALNKFSSSSEQYINKLQGQHQRLNDYLSSGIVGMVVLDNRGTIQELNNFICECTGYSKDELTRMDWIHLISEDDKSSIARIQRRLLKQETTGETFSFQLTAKDGLMIWVECCVKYEPATSQRQGFYVAFIRDITGKKESESRIQQLAFFDELTQLPNRRMLSERLEQAIHRAKRHNHLGAVMFIDLDFFKDVNDSLGHQIGDKLLRQVAERLKQHIRQEDTLARIGGDEFVLITPHLPGDHDEAISSVSQLGNRILTAISKPYLVDEHKLHITASAGVSFFPFDAWNLQDLLRQADTAMYRSKAAGRGGLKFFTPDMQQKANERLNLRNQLQQAVAEEQFELYLQPQLEVESGEIIGAECLIRWQHPEDGVISPADFIPIAEESGLIIEIGDWVINTACKQLRYLEQQGHTEIKSLSINISPRQFHRKGFVDSVKRIIAYHQVDARKLCFELTENLLVDSFDSAVAIVNQLKSIGIAFSIDDFGTGYSSLSYLTQLPLDEIKIDKSFIDHVPGNHRDTTIVNTIVSMAHSMGAKVVAEGVETSEQLAYLKEKQCELYQGYLASRPVTLPSFCKLLSPNSAHILEIHSAAQELTRAARISNA
jgi:diguanylate cyclase (GGDEF)-like protein/PAS domain S-box-containing protein